MFTVEIANPDKNGSSFGKICRDQANRFLSNFNGSK
jgi:hypothetical protein